MGQTLAQFGRPLPPPSEFHRELDGLVVDGLVDFGSLTSQHQQQVVGQVADSDERRRQLRCLNPWLEDALQQDRACGPVVEENANVVRRVYSLEACGRRLSQLYRAVADSPRTAQPADVSCRTDLGRVSSSCQVSTDSRRVMTEQCREIIRRHSRPLAPLPTGQSPVLRALGPLDAVLFDVYGTLLVSASGDVGVSATGDRSEAIAAALAAVGVPLGGPAADALDVFLRQIEREHHAARQAGVDFPEVDIVQVWRDALAEFAARGWVTGAEGVDLPALAVEFEVRVNPIWPMPKAAANPGRLAACRQETGRGQQRPVLHARGVSGTRPANARRAGVRARPAVLFVSARPGQTRRGAVSAGRGVLAGTRDSHRASPVRRQRHAQRHRPGGSARLSHGAVRG